LRSLAANLRLGSFPAAPQAQKIFHEALKLIDVAIVGAGFTGLAAGFELVRNGFKVAILEQDKEPGGLAGSFVVQGQRLEKFYHHWFTSDQHMMGLVRDLGREHDVVWRATNTGMYYAHNIFRLSTPKDVLEFRPLSFADRLRLGYVALAARRVKDWKSLEDYTAKEWLLKHGGEEVYRVVWEPLLVGKFGEHAEEVSAVWLWNKLKLRGGSRGRAGEEMLAYYTGGFGALAYQIVTDLQKHGADIQLDTCVLSVLSDSGKATGVMTAKGFLPARSVLVTTPLPIAANLLKDICAAEYIHSLRRIRYLSNVCVVLELDRSLSSMYWLNVNDPSFPFVGVIEHTNFEPPAAYGGKHIVYLSKYLSPSAELYQMSNHEVIEIALTALGGMFPEFNSKILSNAHVWRADYSQPIVERNYRRLVPDVATPVRNLFLSSMAQIYPEDRGTNYAVRNGREAARAIARSLGSSVPNAAAARV
jgi:protoporphyrinogen oxidase